MVDMQIKTYCENLEKVLYLNDKSDIDAIDLVDELRIIKTLIAGKNPKHVIEILNIVNEANLENLLPNAVIAY